MHLLALAASALALHLPSPLPERQVEVPILMYHRVDAVLPTLPPLTQRLTVDPRDFERQMAWLHRHRYHTITQRRLFQALEAGRPLPSRPVLITFDDGYRDVALKAMPVLGRFHMRATAYVITDRISAGDTSFLTWRLLRRMERGGIEIGSHTVNHLELPALSDAAVRRQLTGSRAVLERHLGHPVQWLAYPAGKYDSRTVALAERAGYVLAVTTRPGRTQRAQAPFELQRYEILDSTGVAGLAAMLG